MQLDGGFVFQDLYVYPAEGGGPSSPAYNYLPLQPKSETDAQGRSSLLSIPMGQGGLLQLGTHLGVSEASLEALRLELAARLKLADPSSVELQPAALQVQVARLQVLSPANGGPSPEWKDLAFSHTSGFYPFTAVFHSKLNPDQQNALIAALQGRTGFLQVRYEVSLPVPARTEARISGDVHELAAALSALPGPLSDEKLREQANRLLDQALERGSVKIEIFSSTLASDELRLRVTEEARKRMLDLLLKMLAGQSNLSEQAQVEVSAQLSEPINCPLELVTDVATWFGEKGMDHVLLRPSD